MDGKQLVEFLTDPETSLLGRDYFLLRLEEEFKKSWRYGWDEVLLLVDVDGLEKIATDEGQAAYRSAILDITGEILTASRDTDLSARVAPSRFAILLAGTDEAGARAFVERVIRAILDGGFGRFEMHVGAAVSPADGLGSVDDLMRRAETAVGQARAEGPNRFAVWNG